MTIEGNDNYRGSALRYGHYTKINKYILIPTAALFMLSMLAMINSFWMLNDIFDISILDEDSYSFIKMILALLIMIFALISMRVRLITESILILLMSLSTIILSVSELSLGMSGFSAANVFFMVGYLSCSYIYLVRKEFMMGIATLSMSIALFIVSTDIWYGDIIFGIGMMVAGLIYFLKATRSLLDYTRGKELFIHVSQKDMYSDAEYAHILVSTVGILSFAILSLVMGYYVLDVQHSMALYIFKMTIAVVVLLFGTYALSKGIVTEGLMMFLVAISAFIFSLLHIMGVEGPILLDLVISIFFLPLAYKFFKEKDYLMVMTSILLFFVFFLESFTDMAAMGELAITALKIVAAVTAISTWVYYDTGKELIPHLHRARIEVPKPEAEGHAGDRAEDQVKGGGQVSKYITITSFLVTALLILWSGVTYINIEMVFTETNLITYSLTKIILAAFSLIFTYDSFRKGMLTEGIMTMIISISAISFSTCYVVFGVSGPASLDVLFSIGLYVAGFIFVVRRDAVLAIASIVMGVAMTYPFFYNVDTSIPMGVGFTITGTILACYALAGLISDNEGAGILHLDRRPKSNGFDSSKSSMLVTTAGYFMMGAMALMLVTSNGYVTFTVAEMFLAGVITIFSTYALLKNHVAEGLLMLIFAVPTLAYSCTVLGGFEPTSVIEVMMFLMGAVVAIMFYIRKTYLLTISAASLGILVPLGIVFNMDAIWLIGMVVFAVTSIVYSVNRWVASESGVKMVPKLL